MIRSTWPPIPAAAPAVDPMHKGAPRGVAFTAITEDWRLRGRMQINGRLSDALNKREAIAITDVVWGPTEAGAQLDPAPGLKSVDPYDLILVTAGEDSLPPLVKRHDGAGRANVASLTTRVTSARGVWRRRALR